MYGNVRSVLTVTSREVPSFQLADWERDAGVVFLESSPEYMYSYAVPGRMKDLMPSSSLIAILREPADRMYSHWVMDCRHEKAASFRMVDGNVTHFKRERPDPTKPEENRWPTPEVPSARAAAVVRSRTALSREAARF